VCLVIGLLPFVVAHPYIRAVLPVLVNDFVDVVPFLIVRLGTLKDHSFSRLRLWKGRKGEREIMKADQDDEDEDAGNKGVNESIPPPLSMAVGRLLDDDLLSDQY